MTNKETKDAGFEQDDVSAKPTGRNIITVIGIDAYEHWRTLEEAVNDAAKVRDLFIERFGFEEPIEPIFNELATSNRLHHLVLSELPQCLTSDDVLILFFAGHGHSEESQVGKQRIETGFIIPVEAQSKWDKETKKSKNLDQFIDLEHWLKSISRLPAHHILVILDSCHSGFAVGPAMTRYRGPNSYHDRLVQNRSRKIITASRANQLALDGLFAGELVKGLAERRADLTGDGLVTGSELGFYVQDAVGKKRKDQTPDYGEISFDERGEIIFDVRNFSVPRDVSEKLIDGSGKTDPLNPPPWWEIYPWSVPTLVGLIVVIGLLGWMAYANRGLSPNDVNATLTAIHLEQLALAEEKAANQLDQTATAQGISAVAAPTQTAVRNLALTTEAAFQAKETSLASTVEAINAVKSVTEKPTPAQVSDMPTPSPSFGMVSFCVERNFNKALRRCEKSQNIFTDPVKIIYISWPYENVYKNMRFHRDWYWNGQLDKRHGKTEEAPQLWDGDDWQLDGETEYTFISGKTETTEKSIYLPQGNHQVRLFIEGELQQIGNFSIEQSYLYRVSNVSLNDTLSIRSGPSASDEKIGDIPPDGTGIEIRGAPAEDWIPVKYGQIEGWVHSKFVTEQQSARLQPTATPIPPVLETAMPVVDAVFIPNTGSNVIWMDRTEVSNANYQECIEANECTTPESGYGEIFERDSHPAVGVNQVQAIKYCSWVGGRLPKAFEWYLAASSADKQRWPWGDEPQPNCERAVINGCNAGHTEPVDSGEMYNGIYNLIGNVWEWTADQGEIDTRRVVMGGSWSNPDGTRQGGFDYFNPMPTSNAAYLSLGVDHQDNTVGFRCMYEQKPN